MENERITVGDIIDLIDYNREGNRNIRIIDSESRGDGSLIQTDSVLLEFLAKLPVDCLDAKGNVIVKMSDLIDRQALLKQIDIDSDGEPGYYGDTWKFIDTIKSMPPATQLSTNLASLGTDCISRQNAIEVIERARAHIGHNMERSVGRVFLEMLDDVGLSISKLPPIQPKRGKWIKTARWGRVYYCDQCRNYLDFDGVNAGRGSTNYCPNCGCRMDGGEQ